MSSKGGGGGRGGGGEGSRVSIPDNAKKTIQSIREITGKQHSDEEIYAVLKEFSMDPNETAQKLLFLDTFHEVKRKRDKKKETAGTQSRGGRGSRGNYYTSSGKDAGVGKNASARREKGANHTSDRGSMPLPVSQKVKNNTASHTTKTATAIPNGITASPNRSTSHGHGPQVPVDGVHSETKDGLLANKPKTISVQPAVTELAAPIPAQSFSSLIRGQEKSTSNSNASSTSRTSATVSIVNSSASDPVLAPIVSQHAGPVGTIKHEIECQQEAAEVNHIQGNKHVTHDIDVSKTEKTASEVPSSMHGKKAPSKSKVAEQAKQSKPIEPALLQVVTSEVAAVTIKANSQLLADSNVPNGQHVTFPIHFKVSEALKNGLTFGSFDDSFRQGTKHNNVTSVEINSACPVDISQGSDETAREPSSRSQGILSDVEGDNADKPQSPPEFEKVPESDGNISSDADFKVDQSNQELHLNPEGNQSVIPNVPSYGFGFMPASASHLVQLDEPEARVHDVSSIVNFATGNSLAPSGSSTPPVQSSVAAAPQAVHLFRQPFPPNCFYPHYLSPFYMHPMHQFLNPSGLPQQPSTGNVYMPPGAAAPGVKFPLPQFKPGTNVGNPAHLTIPSGYGPLTSPFVGFNLSFPSVTSGSSSSKENLVPSQLKENHIYTTGPMVPFSPAQAGHGAFAGLYQSPQTMAAPSNVNTLLQQSQAMAAAVGTVGPPTGAYQQPQLAQINWNTNY
ncbi:GBF-interacting protein 1-like isoform X2 [Durio zibethinus]|uniref:GBF-interacting protein 1-like isoform X2 n=1 Tax=Durio zibethinus TaxID=66656 RepID=A0A6P5WL62_DURZI|nr:GBF-interacting protein 1-like isoform X2 [Durio zibethinus]